MNSARTKFYKPALLALAAVFFLIVAQMQSSLNRERQKLGFTRGALLDNAPPVLQFTTVALGGFRGLIANALWIRASELQEEEKFFEMVQLADWITKLEPHYVQVWLVQSWNMAYNISVKFKEPQDRWRWVQRGIELLRDDGLRYNPDETLIYRELSWFFQHKMGQNLDDAHNFYKQAWADQMQKLFGGRPNYAELLNPKTAAATERAKNLREKYKMDPQVMQEVDKLYGPLEWRLPDAHAIYWAELGRRKAKSKDQETLRRSIYQTMQQAFIRGGLTENKMETNTFILGPNLEMVANCNKAYETMMAEDASMRDHIKTGHRNFLLQAVYLLYVDSRKVEAVKWFKYLKEKYPDYFKQKYPGVGLGLTLDDYAIQQVTEEVGDTDVNKSTAVIKGYLRSSFIRYALDEDDQAVNFEQMAQRIWARFQSKISGAEGRIGLRPMSELKKIVRDEVFDPERGLPPEFAARLRTKLNLPAPTNAPSASVHSPK